MGRYFGPKMEYSQSTPPYTNQNNSTQLELLLPSCQMRRMMLTHKTKHS